MHAVASGLSKNEAVDACEKHGLPRHQYLFVTERRLLIVLKMALQTSIPQFFFTHRLDR